MARKSIFNKIHTIFWKHKILWTFVGGSQSFMSWQWTAQYLEAGGKATRLRRGLFLISRNQSRKVETLVYKWVAMEVWNHEYWHYRLLHLGGGGRVSGDSVRAGPSGDRIPVWARFSAPVQTGPVAQPASYTMGTGSFPGLKRLGRSVVHPPPYITEVEGSVELYICSPSGPSWPVLGWPLPLPL